MTSNNPAKDVKKFKENNVNMRILSNDEFQKLYNCSTDSLKAFLLIAVNTGMRPNEIFKLKWKHVDLKQRYINITDSKNGDSRIIPINDVLYDCLNGLKKANEHVLTHIDGNPVKSNKVAFSSALSKSGIEHCRVYDLRHTFASNLVMSGVDIVTVKELMGHKDINMTMRYSHPTPEHKKHAVNRLNFNNFDSTEIQSEAVEKLVIHK
ncbi:MAG: site-specific integrase [Candidatus Dadabacteria bacterium]|nr:site-specific integrase [Candidatus Dadabacteria bacterium]NIS07352.1 site-specific integrase [Candidatus Dadabacteria bacterium]NIV41296.1 tyrosine-type recombinase/integrase [Candidatus Dadabacteria bacterium]NIY20989.1 tyrosine-type recombinase/integrase [Candidatus Dadabacteria bacterium]